MKLEVGQFARFKSGYIVKVLNVKDNWIETDTKFITRTFPKDFVKASYNIIDLIEVGDYVNSKKVGYIDDCKGAMREYYYDYENASVDAGHWFEEIQTIVTKEQFSQMQYEVD